MYDGLRAARRARAGARPAAGDRAVEPALHRARRRRPDLQSGARVSPHRGRRPDRRRLRRGARRRRHSHPAGRWAGMSAMDIEKLIRACTPTPRSTASPTISRGGTRRGDHPRPDARDRRGRGRRWQTGKCSGTMYCGDMRSLRPSSTRRSAFTRTSTCCSATCARAQTRFECEIIAMTLDMMHGDAARARSGDSSRAA